MSALWGANDSLVPSSPAVLLSTTPSDSHTWNLIFLRQWLSELGYRVVVAGPCTTAPELYAALETHGQFVAWILSTVNGHGVVEIPEFCEALDMKRWQGFGGPPCVAGGLLGTNGPLTLGELRQLYSAGLYKVIQDGDLNELEGLLVDLSGPRTRPGTVA